MGVFVFGEAHVEYALVMECLLKDFDKLAFVNSAG